MKRSANCGNISRNELSAAQNTDQSGFRDGCLLFMQYKVTSWTVTSTVGYATTARHWCVGQDGRPCFEGNLSCEVPLSLCWYHRPLCTGEFGHDLEFRVFIPRSMALLSKGSELFDWQFNDVSNLCREGCRIINIKLDNYAKRKPRDQSWSKPKIVFKHTEIISGSQINPLFKMCTFPSGNVHAWEARQCPCERLKPFYSKLQKEFLNWSWHLFDAAGAWISSCNVRSNPSSCATNATSKPQQTQIWWRLGSIHQEYGWAWSLWLFDLTFPFQKNHLRPSLIHNLHILVSCSAKQACFRAGMSTFQLCNYVFLMLWRV
jgi:hypothetical protein